MHDIIINVVFLRLDRFSYHPDLSISETFTVVQPTAIKGIVPAEAIFEKLEDEAGLILEISTGSDAVVADTGEAWLVTGEEGRFRG
jgi:hypothetical protein